MNKNYLIISKYNVSKVVLPASMSELSEVLLLGIKLTRYIYYKSTLRVLL